MIQKLGQVMLYVNNQDQSAAFWTEVLEFQVVSDQTGHGMRWIELAPKNGKGSHIVLHDKAKIAKMSPELSLGTPSLMFYASQIDELYQSLKDKGVTVGEIVNMGTGRVFNFADYEENYFAVMEV
ncbi:VOC family protein [Alkalicoccobacillus gibsonii]|uniref:VOC family protein n=1 Tax=Alkalicoccobacillus gibsonii TaxID=79881 RepID=UPI0035143296